MRQAFPMEALLLQAGERTHFSAKRKGAELSMDGVDVLRVEDGKIAEVWLFSNVQQDEDAFWGTD